MRAVPARGLLIQPDGTLSHPRIAGLRDIHQAVGSDKVDFTNPTDIGCWCHGQAIYELPANPIATRIYQAHNYGQLPPALMILCGPVLILGPADAAGDETDCPAAVVSEAVHLKAELGPELPALAVPLSEDQRQAFRARQAYVAEQMEAAFAEGRGIDVGGIYIGRLNDEGSTS